MPSQSIVLYGSSICILSIETILRQNPALEIVRVEASGSGFYERLLALKPVVIVFDRLATAPEALLPLLLAQPALLLVGMDAGSSQVLTLAGEFFTVGNGQDLTQLMLSQLPLAMPAQGSSGMNTFDIDHLSGE